MTLSMKERRMKLVGVAAASAILLAGALPVGVHGNESGPDFATAIRPLLSENCFQCHGPDDKKRKAGLRLDTREGATADLGDYAAVVPGDPDRSELIRRITSTDPDEMMPPPDKGDPLRPEQIAAIRSWIESGAEWATHWAFTKPTRPSLPAVNNSDWVSTPIDFFTLARMEANGLSPSPEAEPLKLLRRLHLDITGLPPTLAEIESFKADTGAGAWQRRVESLLQSPHYGERWGRHWLDAARYADSDGFEKDKPRDVWLYREWVIRALNQDLPYDRFVIHQIAGDLLPSPDQDQRVATGFLRNSMINEEGGIDPEQFRMDAMFDRMDAIGKSILGLTIQCAQCHTHKYDPLTHTEYYRLFAFINDSAEGSMVAYSPAELQQKSSVMMEIQSIEEEIRHHHPDWEKRMAEWELTVSRDQPEWDVVRLFNAGDNSQRYHELEDRSLRAGGYAPTYFTATFTNSVDHAELRSVRLEALTDPNLPAGGPGRSVDGLFALSEFKVKARSLADPSKERWVTFTNATADYSNPDHQLGRPYTDREGNSRGITGSVGYALDGKNDTGWGIDAGPGRRNQPRRAVFNADSNFAYPGGTFLEFHLTQSQGGWNSDDNQNLNLGRFRISVSDEAGAVADPLPARVRQLLSIPPDRRTPSQQRTVFSHFRTTVSEWEGYNDRIEAAWKRHPEGTTQLVLSSMDADRDTYRLERGDFLKPAERVRPGVPEFLHPLPEKDNYNRLDFAEWLVSRDSPTTARAIVNRIWQSYFGTGIVATSEDLGSQSQPPTHPQLLDWLAVEFMENDWRLKHIHRLIVNSSTYRQTSRIRPELMDKDPLNQFLARSPRFRVEGEIVRDIALAASGLLDRTIGGPSVYPPAPEFLFVPPASYGPKIWETDNGGDRYRRAIYTFRFRSVPYPMLEAFDVPNGDFSCVRRSRSNTPQQALTALNEPVFMECSRSLARLALDLGGDQDADRIRFAFRRCLTREPDAGEIETLHQFLEAQRSRFRSGQLDPIEIAGPLPAAASAPVNQPEIVDLAAYTALTRVLLNLDETITRE